MALVLFLAQAGCPGAGWHVPVPVIPAEGHEVEAFSKNSCDILGARGQHLL